MEATAKKAAVGQPGRRSQNADRCIGARIRERRMMLGLTQQELAELIGITSQQVNKYEKASTGFSLDDCIHSHRRSGSRWTTSIRG